MEQIQMVDLHSQYVPIKDEIDSAIQSVIDQTNFINGPQVAGFAADLAAYTGAKHVIPCANGTDALQIALMALGLQPGDEVIVPAFTYAATAEVIGLLHLVPVLTDVDPDTFNITVQNIEKALTPRTRAIVPVHLFGQSCDMAPILDFAQKHQLFVVEDNAQSLGAVYSFSSHFPFPSSQLQQSGAPNPEPETWNQEPETRNLQGTRTPNPEPETWNQEPETRNLQGTINHKPETRNLQGTRNQNPETNCHTGTMGHIGCTSFFPSKNLGCFGDGGAMMTQDSHLSQLCRTIANHGQEQKYLHKLIGCNSRLDTLQAAILKVKLQHLDRYSEARRLAAKRYDELLKDVTEITRPYQSPFSTHVYHQYTLKVKEGKRDALQQFLAQKGIPSMIYYPQALQEQEAFKKIARSAEPLLISTQLARSVLSLPMHTELTEQQQEYIAQAIKVFFT